MNISKFNYPLSSNGKVIIRSKRKGLVKREFQKDMPFELNNHLNADRYSRSIKQLNQVALFTLVGQLLSLAPTLLIGAVILGVGESRRTSSYTPIYWYIGIILLGLTGLFLLILMCTFRSKYQRNLILAVDRLNTSYTNEFGINWQIKIVEWRNRKGHHKKKVWCEVILPNNGNGESVGQNPPIVVVDYPYNYPTTPNTEYVPMTYYYSTQPNQPFNPNQPVNSQVIPMQPFSGQSHQLQPNYYNIPIDGQQQQQYQQPSTSDTSTDEQPKVSLNKQY
ncbi:hypothetical protein DLAC_00931 [Tieghemostelium lacteum]|uniref:Uncharacterized protein n=1 Tax=Tieghemostelium lacteum TaxID=361077 RepID=A0A152A7M2_TIELA|nr:hypothetical protein DLAC_00931 [Tieghemostelium lacteum]|eukprot:KYR02131.1 hypothetical protein DLAC_00931 [Tieghemostelium lacteum]